MEISKSDWKLFRELLPMWQERYMERILEEYKEIVDSNKIASSRFWELDERIKNDKKKYGVIVRDLRKSEVEFITVMLIREGAITEEDLMSFSSDFKEIIFRNFK